MRAWFLPLLCAGCATGPVPLPRTAIARGTQVSQVDGIEIHVETVNERNWTEHPALKARVIWDEPVWVWGLYSGGHRDIVVPMVPLPSFEVTIDNHSPETVSFAEAQIGLEDDTGQSYPVYEVAEPYLARVVDRMAGRFRELLPMTIAFSSLLPPWAFAPSKMPALALAEASRRVPLFGRGVQVAPGESWRGALVPNIWAGSPDELARLLHGKLAVIMEGVHVGTRALGQQAFLFDGGDPIDHVVCSDGRNVRTPSDCTRPNGYASWMPGGPCLQVGEARYRSHASLTYDVQYLDGRRVTTTDMYQAMLSTAASRADARGARALRVAGYALLLGGVGGAAVTAGAIDLAGHSRLAPAGLGVLGVSVVGSLLVWLGRKRELNAVRDYNQFAFATGACAAPL